MHKTTINCRVGSLEIMQDIFLRCIDINCRVGSLEKQGQLHKGLCHHAAVPISLSFAEKTFKMHLNMKATGNNVI